MSNIKANFNKLYVGNTEIDANSNVNITGNISTAGNLSVSGTLTLLDSNSSNINNLVCNKITTSGLITANNGITCNSKNINSVADPIVSTDAATKAYVDAQNTNQIITNSNITNNTINPLKLVLPNNTTTYLRGDGTFQTVSSGATKQKGTFGLDFVNTGIVVSDIASFYVSPIMSASSPANDFSSKSYIVYIIYNQYPSNPYYFAEIQNLWTTNFYSNTFSNGGNLIAAAITVQVVANVIYIKYNNGYGAISFTYREI